MKVPVYVIERSFSGGDREIVALTFDKELVVTHIDQDVHRWTFPVTYHINMMWPSYMDGDTDDHC